MTDIDAEVIELHRADAQRFPGGNSWIVVQLGDALAAERERADRAEARLADAQRVAAIEAMQDLANYMRPWGYRTKGHAAALIQGRVDALKSEATA